MLNLSRFPEPGNGVCGRNLGKNQGIILSSQILEDEEKNIEL